MTDDEEDTPARPAVKGGALPADRKTVVNKLWRAAKRQIAAYEKRLADLPAGAAASESDAKALATLARTVRELVSLDAVSGQGAKSTDDLSPAEGSRHVAGLREELARRLEALAAERLGEADPAGPA